MKQRSFLVEWIGYLLGSVIALAADIMIFALLTRAGWNWCFAATGGFLVGSAVAYVISVRWVFARRSFRSRPAEIAVFFLIGCAGLAVVQGVMWFCIAELEMSAVAARLVAVLFSFTANFLLRRLILFGVQSHADVLRDGEIV